MYAGNYTISAGFCAGVGVSGHASGGGLGPATRKLGWLIDSLLSVTGVTAEGLVVTANSTSNPDLFWALKGGGASFLVVTEWTFKIHQAPASVAHAIFVAPAASMKEMLSAYINWSPWNLSSNYAFVELTLTPAGNNWVDIFYWGPMSQVSKDFLASPLGAVPGIYNNTRSKSAAWPQTLTEITGKSLQNMTYEAVLAAQYTGGIENGTIPPAATGYKAFKASSLLFNTTLSVEAQQALVSAVTTYLPKGRGVTSWFQLKALGGSVLDGFKWGSAALPHRDVLVECQVYISGVNSTIMSSAVRNVKAAMKPYTSHPFFYNYFDCDDIVNVTTVDRWTMYFGHHTGRLRKLKAQYDPNVRIKGLYCGF
jgi:hypothetical protein